MSKISASTENSLLLPKVDFIFKKIFGEEKNKELLQDFLANVLNFPKEKITGLTLTNKELVKDYADDKKGTLDVRVEMDDENERGKKVEIDVEIQLKIHASMAERILFYWSKMFVQAFEEGMVFPQLRKTISITIFDETFLKATKKYHSKFHIWEDEERLLFSDALEVHVIELQKAMKFIDATNPTKNGLLNWLLFLSNDKLEVCEMLSAQNPIFDRAVQEQKNLSQNREIRAYYDRRLVEKTDELTRLYYAEHRGEQRGKLEVVLNMLKAGLPVEQIAAISNLAPEEILALRR